ncbi:SPARC-like protein 1 [Pyxicephalus adspersus]|uniref:SPARC-like protein 1 n=1 Tax=Pyxicephalus adspersus TaxID=30357 RepID=UPI003B5B414E
MNIFIVLSFVVGIYFASSATSFNVKHDVRQEQRLNGSMQEQVTTGNTGEKMTNEPSRQNEGRLNTKSMGHNKHELDAFLLESLINLNGEESKINSLPDLDGKQKQNKYTNKYDKEGRSKETSDSNEDTDVLWITGNSEQKPKIQSDESDDEQSGDGLPSDELSDVYANLHMKSNILNAESDGDSNKEYIYIPEEIDEDLQYVLNSTNGYYMNNKLQNKTSKDHFLKKSGALLVSETNKKADKGDSYNRVKSENHFLIHSNKGRNMTTPKDNSFMQKIETDGEETVDQSKKSTVSGVDVTPQYRNKIIKYGQRENSTDQTSIFHSNEHAEILLNNSIVQDTGSSLKKNIKNDTNQTKLADPCANFHCKKGKMCKTDESANPFCACQDSDLCQPTNLNDRVCGTDNKTYSSDCYLFARKCRLEGTKEGSHLHLDYQGPCKYIPPCTDYELAHFPFRMRDWLKNVLVQLYERGLENSGLLSEKQRNKVKKIYENEKRLQEGDHNIELLVKDFQKNYHMYVYPVHWQFNQLDQHSIDRLLTRSELSALRAPLIPMEHCVTAFLQGCNTNNDKHISLQEWCHCFGIGDGDIDENLLF